MRITEVSTGERTEEKGIYKRNDCNTWRAIITVNGKTVNISSYKTEQEAIDAYKKPA